MRSESAGPGAMRMPEAPLVVRCDRPLPAELEPPQRRRIEDLLAEFLRETGADGAMLVEKAGWVLARAGDDEHAELVHALAAGSFELATEMKGLLGRRSICVSTRGFDVDLALVGDRAIVATAFGCRVALSAVRFSWSRVSQELRQLLDSLALRSLPINRSIRADGEGGPALRSLSRLCRM